MHDARDLTTRLADLLHREHAALADFLIALADFDRERRRLELDHIVPVARGGASTVANLRVTCRVHNQYAARQAFGDAWMDQFASKPRTASG